MKEDKKPIIEESSFDTLSKDNQDYKKNSTDINNNSSEDYWESSHYSNNFKKDDNSKRFLKKLMLISIFLIISIIIIMLFPVDNNENNKNIGQEKYKSTNSNYNSHSSLPNYKQFDFSPIDGTPKVETIPIFPKKYFEHGKKENEFEGLLYNEDRPSKLTSNKDYNSLTFKELKEISRQYLPTWKQNSVPIGNETRGYKAIYSIVIDYNISDNLTSQLPPVPIALAIEGYDNGAQNIINDLKPKGYEFLLQLPLETSSISKTTKIGKSPIRKKMSFEDIRKRIDWHNNKVKGHIGFKNFQSSDVLADYGVMNWTMNQISKKGLTFLEVAPKGVKYHPIANVIANSIDVPSRNAKIINSVSKDLPKFLSNLIKDGASVALIDGTANNIKELSAILKEQRLKYPDIKLVPLSYIYTYDNVMNDKTLI